MPLIRYPHLSLVDWPFRIEPDESFYGFLADRKQLRKDIESLLHQLSRRTPSSIHLMWAWFGAGKTHTLRYLEHRARENFPSLMPIYTAFPKATKGFLDLYQLTIARIDLERVIGSFEEIYTHKDGNKFLRRLQLEFPDLSLAFKKLLGAPEVEQDICIRWLRGGDVDKKMLRSIGINRAINTTEDAISVLCWCIETMNAAAELAQSVGTRLMWLIDEYQRVKNCRPAVRDEINTAIHSVFNRAPRNLSIIISFSGRPEEKRWPEWLSPEIRDRIGVISNILLLPPLGREEAFQFVSDILAFFRPAGAKCGPFFPFTEAAVQEILKQMQQKKAELKPRAIMQFFTAVLDEAEPKIESGKIKEVTDEFVQSVLKQHEYRENED